MSIKDLLDMALRTLIKRKLRTFLTILGVVIGTASIVVMVSIGLGMNRSFAEQIESQGSLQVVTVHSSSGGGGGRYGGGMEISQSTNSSSSSAQKGEILLDAKAVEAFREIENVEVVSPVKNLYLMMSSGKYVSDAQFIGIEPEAMEALGYTIDQGRSLEAEDKRAIVVGGGVEFYDPRLNWEMRYNSPPPEMDILGEKLDITFDWNYGTKHADDSLKTEKFEVVGTMSAESNNSWSVIMPLKELERIEKAQKKWEEQFNSSYSTNEKEKKQYDEVAIKVNDIDHVKAVQQQINDMGHRASSLVDQLEAAQETTKMLRVMLGAIGAISLLVAAIGITNTMVMAIYERTREIGIMKVIGASLWDIKRLFLVEAAFIGFSGGVIGVSMSFILSKIVNYFAMQQGSEMSSYIPIELYFGAIAFATCVGVLAGYFPANRAMKLSALSAIKTE